MNNVRRPVGIVFALALLMTSCPAFAQDGPADKPFHVDLPRPGDREFVLDQAELISPEDRQQLQKLCDKLLTETATPIIVVTIPSMAAAGGDGLRIETFARLLFDQWGIGLPEVNGQAWNTGILLLVSEGDRKARIELGAGWGREQDGLCRRIMDEQIIPCFKRGDFSGGIVAGATALDKMARGLALPTRPRPWWHYGAIVGFIVLVVWTVVSMIRRGSSGWAWLFWGVVLGLLGALLYSLLTRSGRGGRGGGFSGGFSGGSFGGGFSGGGGATGSW
ncbi:MAG: TPM domain-containing protein [Planctomycetota bacterium]|jgi:uncharacterized protein